MKKYLLTFELRYTIRGEGGEENEYRTKRVTIGVYDTFKEACLSGNAELGFLESKFDLHKFPDGSKAKKERFGPLTHSKYKTALISNLAYLQTPFTFYAKIETLDCSPLGDVIDEALTDLRAN